MPPTLRGILWMVLAAAHFAVIYVLIRQLTTTLSVYETAFLRGVIGFCGMLPWLMRAGIISLRTTRTRLYGVRAAFNLVGTCTWFYTLANLPLANATALIFTGPLFTILLAGMALREPVGLRRWLAAGVGFLGVMMILRPGVIPVGWPALTGLATALIFSSTQICTKSLVKTEPPNAVVFWNYALLMLLSAPLAAIFWVTPRWEDMPVILLFGALSLSSQLCLTRAYLNADISIVSPVSYMRLPFVALIAFILYSELPDPWTWAGAVVICVASWYLARAEGGRAGGGGG